MKRRNIKAFTIVELVIVIAVIAILAAVMIPTFSGLIKVATISADEAELTSLNHQLAINEVKDDDDLYALIKETYGEAKATDFSPRSAKYGLNYWYDVDKNEVVLSEFLNLDAASETPDDPDAEGEAANKVVLLGTTEPAAKETKRNEVFYEEHKDDIRMHHGRYFCLDLSGIIGDVLVAMETGDAEALSKATEALTEAAQALTKAAEHFTAMAEALNVRLGELATLESFTVTADKGISVGDTIYVPYDVKTFTLTAGGFVSDNGGELGEVTVEWDSSNALAAVDENGKVTLSLPAVGAESEVVITATATVGGEGEPKSVTKTIAIVRINAVTLEAEFGSIELDNTGDVLPATITYDGTKDSFSVGSITASSYNYTIEGLELNDALTFETTGEIFTIDGNNLVLTKKAFGTQNLTIKVGDYITDTVAITVVDNSSSPFEVNNITNDVKMGATYLFRVGNGNAFTLDRLFKTEKAPDNVTLSIYDAAKTSGTGTLNAIATSGSGFTATYTSSLTKDTWGSSTIKFSGTGVAIIEITSDKGTATLAVEVVNGKNVTAASDFSGATNYVLLNDITWGTANKTAINGTLYGNGFAINATAFTSATTTSNNALFYLNGGTIDNIVINGPVYPELIYQSETSASRPYYVAGIYTTGNAKIINSYISGFRSPVMADSTYLHVENTTLVGGNYANLWLNKGNLYLKNVTTVQEKKYATVGDTSKQILGAGIVVSSGISNLAEITIEGYLNQYNWVTSSDKSYLDTDIQAAVSTLFSNSTITHNGRINTGILFMGSRTIAVGDSRSDKASVPYQLVEISPATIYTYVTTNGAVSSFPTYGGYTPNAQMALKPTFKDNLGTTNGKLEYSIDIPNGATCTVDASVYTVSKYTGQSIAVNISCNGGTQNGNKFTFSAAGTYTITYEVVDNTFYNADGSRKTDNVIDTYTVTVVVANSNHPNAVIDVSGVNKTLYMTLENTKTDSDYAAAFAILDGLKITDYNEDGSEFTVTISATELPAGLTVSATGFKGTPVTKTFTYNGATKLYLYESSPENNQSGYDTNIVVTYKYTGKNGKEVTATVTHSNVGTSSYTTLEDNRSGGCVTPDTLVTLADGTQKEIQYVTYEDMLLVWNFNIGKYDVMPASIVMNHGYDNYTVVTLTFSDGTTINTINGHGFFDVVENKYVIIDESNAADYVGHEFVKVNGDGYETVTLESYSVSEQYTESWSILTAVQHNCILENMWTLTPAEVEGSPEYLMPYEVSDDMKYDETKMQADIEKYGLYTYEDFADYCTYEQFVALGLENFKVSVGKGYITWEEIEYLISIHIG